MRIRSFMLFPATIVLLCAGCPGPGVVIDTSERIDPCVENGAAYDKAVIDLSDCRGLVLPANAEVRFGAPKGEMRLFMQKELCFAGHPGSWISIRGERKHMGCALTRSAGTVTLGTFGEWDSQIEGGTRMRVVCVVPDGLRVFRRQALSGPASQPNKEGKSAAGRPIPKVTPSGKWQRIPDTPDPAYTARREGNWGQARSDNPM